MRSKTRRRARLLLHTWICYYRSDGRSTLHFPLQLTCSTSLSFRSWEALSDPRPHYGVFITQLVRYARACSSYECFILKAMQLFITFHGQEYVKELWKSYLRKFYGRYGEFIKQCEVPLSRMLHGILEHDCIQKHPPLMT